MLLRLFGSKLCHQGDGMALLHGAIDVDADGDDEGDVDATDADE